MLEGITFDFWNTLYGEPMSNEVLEVRVSRIGKVLKERGRETGEREIAQAIATVWTKAWWEQRTNSIDIGPRGQVSFIMTTLGINDQELEAEVYQEYAEALLLVPPPLKAGTSQVLHDLAPRLKLALICNTGATPGTVLRKIMAKDGILECFHHLTFSDEIRVSKPDPHIFHYTLSALGVPASHALHVGDDALTDIIGAKKAGMRAAWLRPDQDWPIPECDWHLRSILELPPIVERLLKEK